LKFKGLKGDFFLDLTEFSSSNFVKNNLNHFLILTHGDNDFSFLYGMTHWFSHALVSCSNALKGWLFELHRECIPHSDAMQTFEFKALRIFPRVESHYVPE
jgi:hypothetical protein